MNIQPKQHRSENESLFVNSVFHTIQGEGPSAGREATFIRLAGCNLQCQLCDTEYTNQFTVDGPEIESWVTSIAAKGLIVITGGEPFRQSKALLSLIEAINAVHPHVGIEIESNGTYDCERAYRLKSS